jgi:hypothetical protein
MGLARGALSGRVTGKVTKISNGRFKAVENSAEPTNNDMVFGKMARRGNTSRSRRLGEFPLSALLRRR